MMKRPQFDDIVYPPFAGFPRAGIAFLKKLKKNNTREWFQRYKEEYEETVRFPMQCLIASLRERMAPLAPEIEFHPKKSIFRVHRDTRFSKNKTPYKTNIAASFQFRDTPKTHGETPGLYVGIEPGSVFIGGGLYMPYGDQLKAIRKSIAEHPDDFLEVVRSRKFRKEFESIQGAKLQRAPLGFAPDHPMIEHLKNKQFFVGKEFDDESLCFKPSFLQLVANTFTDAMPLVRWLARVTR